jgi:hypothetical protein
VAKKRSRNVTRQARGRRTPRDHPEGSETDRPGGSATAVRRARAVGLVPRTWELAFQTRRTRFLGAREGEATGVCVWARPRGDGIALKGGG